MQYLRVNIKIFHGCDMRAIIANYRFRLRKSQSEKSTYGHNAHESNICLVIDIAKRRVIIESKWNKAACNTTQVEYTPEQGDVEALACRGWVSSHHGSLASPEEPGTHTEEGACSDDEGLIQMVVVVKEGAHIEDVEGTAEEEGFVRAEKVVDATTQEAKDSKRCVEGGQAVVSGFRILLAAGAHAIDSIEHAGAAEADEADEGDLKKGSVITLGEPWPP
ncbi:hypothetical protein L7F22_024473 [Adiantum nelumboides]|nr:hypothetical protein [Adiantum nelumboides]